MVLTIIICTLVIAGVIALWLAVSHEINQISPLQDKNVDFNALNQEIVELLESDYSLEEVENHINSRIENQWK